MDVISMQIWIPPFIAFDSKSSKTSSTMSYGEFETLLTLHCLKGEQNIFHAFFAMFFVLALLLLF